MFLVLSNNKTSEHQNLQDAIDAAKKMNDKGINTKPNKDMSFEDYCEFMSCED